MILNIGKEDYIGTQGLQSLYTKYDLWLTLTNLISMSHLVIIVFFSAFSRSRYQVSIYKIINWPSGFIFSSSELVIVSPGHLSVRGCMHLSTLSNMNIS